MKSTLFLCAAVSCVLFNVASKTFGDVNNDYYYRPYPILLVHGFNADNETWNANTPKEDKKDLLMTTLIQYSDPNTENDIRKKTDKPSIAKTLIQTFSKTGSLPNNSTDPRIDPNLFKDFYVNESVPPGMNPSQRMGPWEEDGSYNGINHTYVELYGNYYYNEGDDGYGRKGQDAVLHPTFSAKDLEGDNDSYYDIRPVTSYTGNSLGGQTSLVRMRIIQLLNEYYGDWKWVGDPTAKIKIVCHSNGGLIVTNALKLDEEYYDNGNASYHWWNSEEPYDISCVQRGFGFRLKDHIDQIITIDTPFKGSPFASKNGLPSGFSVFMTEACVGLPIMDLISVIWPATIGVAGTKGSWTSLLVMPATAAAFVGILALVEKAAVGGAGSPVMADLAEDGTLVKSLKNKAAPTYTDGSQIPYLNHRGTAG